MPFRIDLASFTNASLPSSYLWLHQGTLSDTGRETLGSRLIQDAANRDLDICYLSFEMTDILLRTRLNIDDKAQACLLPLREALSIQELEEKLESGRTVLQTPCLVVVDNLEWLVTGGLVTGGLVENIRALRRLSLSNKTRGILALTLLDIELALIRECDIVSRLLDGGIQVIKHRQGPPPFLLNA